MKLAKIKRAVNLKFGFWYWGDFYIYPIIAIALFIYGFKLVNFSIITTGILFIIGFILGTFLEYIIHRFFFHGCPIIKDLHQLHHDKPIDPIGTPSFISLLVYFSLIFVPLYLISNLGYACIMFSAILLDFLIYFIVHHMAHYVKSPKGSIRFWYKRYHAVHHKDSSVNFSVAFPIWDVVFRTKCKKRN